MYRLALIRIVCLKNPFDLPNIPEFAFYHWKFRMEKLVLKVKQIPNLESKSSYMNIYFFLLPWDHIICSVFLLLSKVQSLGQEDPLEKEMATHSSVLAWRIPGMDEPGGL